MLMVTAQELGYKTGEATVYEDQRYIDAAPPIKAAGQRALTSAEILRKRVDELNAFDQRHKGERWEREDFERECPWNTRYFDTSTAAHAAEDIIFIHHNSPLLAALASETEISYDLKPTDFAGGHIVLYAGDNLDRLRKEELLDRPLAESQIGGKGGVHPIWLGLADGDEALVRQLAPLVFKALRDVYNTKEGMGTFFSYDNIVRGVVLGGGGDRADAGGYDRLLDYDYVRLVGVGEKEEAAAGRASLETLVGRGTDVGNGLIVVRGDQLSPDVYAALTGKQ